MAQAIVWNYFTGIPSRPDSLKIYETQYKELDRFCLSSSLTYTEMQ